MKKYNVIFLTLILTSLVWLETTLPSIQYKLDDLTKSIKMPKVDHEAMLEEDRSNKGKPIPQRYGYKFDVNYNINTDGIWYDLTDGSKLWQISFYSENAFALKIFFDQFYLPQGSELYIYNKEENIILGPFTYKDNHIDMDFGHRLIAGNTITVEYYEPEEVNENVIININEIIHDYKDILNYYETNSEEERGWCADNVACSSADPYEDQVNSVIFLDMGGYICSAALINNTSQDLTPYVLTAQHCIDGENTGTHNWFTFYFKHQGYTCSSSSGNYNYSETGSYLRMQKNQNSSDVALLEMDDTPPSSFDAYYAGWSKATSYPQISVGIHHPGGNPKEINFDNGDTAYGCSWGGTSTHWCLDWDDGGVAGGSSGSPIFNTDKRIVGQLSGCFVISGNDCSDGCGGDDNAYGKFSTSWNGSNSSSRLKDWLDPLNTGQTTLDGTYDGNSIVYGCTDNNACNYDSNATNNDGSCTYAQGTCDCDGNPTGNYCDCNGNIDDTCGICNGDGTSCQDSAILTFGSVGSNSIGININSEVPVAGFQFDIIDTPDVINITGASGGSANENAFSVSTNSSGTILGFSLTGEAIASGENIILSTINFEGSGGTTTLCFNNGTISNTAGNPLSLEYGECQEIVLSIPGDVNNDNLINVLDVVTLVNIVLGTNNPTDAQFAASDVNNDDVLNVLDIVILVNLILG